MAPRSDFRRYIKNFFSCIFVSLLIVTSAQAELVLSAPPRESADEGNKVYGPLAEHLSKELGEEVTYQHPGSWFSYQKGIRSDKYDIVFDGPHFISWRIKNKGHTPVAKLPGDLSFVLIARAGDTETNSTEDLAGKLICAISPPNLSTLTVLKEYSEDGKPKLKTVKGGMGAVYKSFNEGNCKAAVLRDKFFYKKLSDEDRTNTKVIYSSTPVPNQGITVSSRIPYENRKKITDALTSLNPGTTPLLNRFAPKAEKMSPVNTGEYDSYDMLLSGVVMGW
jgi:ABC-type phosphate/phosphonate transport system substrate-binding protein